MTQRQLAEKAGIKIDGQQIVQAIEARNSRSSVHAPALAEALGVSLEYLLTGEQDGERSSSYFGPPDSQWIPENDFARPRITQPEERHEYLRQAEAYFANHPVVTGTSDAHKRALVAMLAALPEMDVMFAESLVSLIKAYTFRTSGRTILPF